MTSEFRQGFGPLPMFKEGFKALSDDIQPAQVDAVTKAALRRMIRYHVPKMDNAQYQFDIPLIKRWVKERAILDD